MNNQAHNPRSIILALFFPMFLVATPGNLLEKIKPLVHNPQPNAGFIQSKEGSWRLVPPSKIEARQGSRIIFQIPEPLRVGPQYLFECKLRAVQDSTEPSVGQAGILLDVVINNPKSPSKQSIFRQILLAGPDWENFQIPIQSNVTAPAGEWQIALTPEHFNQPLELSELRLRKVSPGEKITPSVSYPGQETNAPWRQKAHQLINQHRMADIAIHVVDQFGSPVSNATVNLQQTRHSYLFGSCVVASRLIDAEVTFKDPDMTREQFIRDNVRYRKEFLRLFNFAVFENDLKWPFWSGEKSKNFSQNTTIAALKWLRDHQIPAKGHTLVWASWRQSPEWLQLLKQDKATLQNAILRHIQDVASATAPFTSYWDVLNEPMSHRDLIELLGHDAVADWFRTARNSLPSQKLVLNEFDLVGNGANTQRQDEIILLINELKESGASPDILGCQSHFWSNRLTPPEKIWEILDKLHTKTGLPIAATEFDINFPNDQLQADYTRDFLTAWFAHPATDSFIMWGFWGGAHWFGEQGAMFRKDWSAKPNLQAYENLVLKQWWTKAQGLTDQNGRFQTRGFLGDYTLEVNAPGHQSALRLPKLDKQGLTIELVLHRITPPSS